MWTDGLVCAIYGGLEIDLHPVRLQQAVDDRDRRPLAPSLCRTPGPVEQLGVEGDRLLGRNGVDRAPRLRQRASEPPLRRLDPREL